MKKFFRKLFVGMILIAVSNLLIVGIGKASAANYYGITTVVGYKSVQNVSGTQYWNAKLYSKILYRTNKERSVIRYTRG